MLDVTIRRTYMLAGQTIATKVTGDDAPESNGTFFLYTDHLGSTSVLVDNLNSVVAGSDTRHLPFGGYRIEPTHDVTDRGFTGHLENRGIGLTYMNARFYVPGIGKFATADTIVPDPTNPQAYNRYSYVENNPVKFNDPSGHIKCDSENLPGMDQAACHNEDYVYPTSQGAQDAVKNAKTNQPRIMDVSNSLLGDEFGFRGLQIIVLPSGNKPQPRNPKTGAVAGWGGAFLDAGEAISSAAFLPAVPEVLSGLDVAVTFAGSYAMGETGIMQPHPSLPNMFILGQDLLVNGGEFAGPLAVKAGASGAGAAICGPPCFFAGFSFGSLTDLGTSVISFTYDSSRALGITPTKVAVGIYIDSNDGRKMPFREAPNGLVTVALIFYED